MKVYLNKIEAVIGLHERGFAEDFELFGTDLLWVQKKIFLRPRDYKITEVYRFPELSMRVYTHQISKLYSKPIQALTFLRFKSNYLEIILIKFSGETFRFLLSSIEL
jgi:hypothetical protein